MSEIVDILVRAYLYDVEVLSTPWILYTVIPAFLYVMFMMVKWAVLTIPVWLPAFLVVGTAKWKTPTTANNEVCECDECKAERVNQERVES